MARHGIRGARLHRRRSQPSPTTRWRVAREGFSLWWLRAVDLSAVVDAVLDDKTFGSQIDPAHIGAAGHSLGGYTVIAVAGGITEPARLQAFCAHPRPARCADRRQRIPTCARSAWRT
jgi:predicted dienelactone hydrolase